MARLEDVEKELMQGELHPEENSVSESKVEAPTVGEERTPISVQFILGNPQEKVNSTKFSWEGGKVGLDGVDDNGEEQVLEALKRVNFYIPKPIGEGAKRLQVTLVEVED